MNEKEKTVQIDDDKILDILDADLKQAEQIQDELSTKREEWYKRFRCAPYGNEREGWSQIVSPVVFKNHQTRLANMMEIFTDEFFLLKSDNQEKASKLQKLIRYQMFRKQDGETKLYEFFFNAGIYPYSVMKVFYKKDSHLETVVWPKLSYQQMVQLAQDKKYQITKYEEVKTPTTEMNPATGEPVNDLTFENVKCVYEVIDYAGAYMDALAPWSFGYSADCKRVAWGGIDGRLQYHKFQITLDEIKRKEKAGIYRKGTYAACLEIGGTAEIKAIDQQAVETSVDEMTEYNTDGSEMDDKLSAELTAKECYTKLDIDKDGLLEPCIITIIADKVVAQKIENPYGRPPFRIGCIIPDAHKVPGISPVSVLEKDAKVQTNLIRDVQDMAAQCTYTSLVTSDIRLQKALAERKPFDVMFGDGEKVKEIPCHYEIEPILKAIELTKGEEEEGSGQTRYNQGLDADSLNKTAYGIGLISKSGEKRGRLECKQIGNSALNGIVRDFIFINQKWPSDEPVKILGTDIEINKDDLRGEFDIEIDIGVSQAEKVAMAGQVDLFLQFATQTGMQLGMTNPVLMRNAVTKKYSLLGLNIDNSLYSVEQMQKNIEEAKKQPPKEDWKEFVQIDKMYPQWPKSVQDQVTEKMGLRPDPNPQAVAGIPQARDIVQAQLKSQGDKNKQTSEMLSFLMQRENHAMDMREKEQDIELKSKEHKLKIIDMIANIANKNNKGEKKKDNE